MGISCCQCNHINKVQQMEIIITENNLATNILHVNSNTFNSNSNFQTSFGSTIYSQSSKGSNKNVKRTGPILRKIITKNKHLTLT